MLRSGVLTGAKLKAAIKVIEVRDDSNLEQQSEQDQPQNAMYGTTPGGQEKDSLI